VPVFRLPDELVFPRTDLAEENGLLAVGGDLSEPRLLLAYSFGIFPWYSEGDPILWWSPDPRLILAPPEIRISRSLKQTIKRGVFKMTMDMAFEEVITSCSNVHYKKAGDTWITDEMISAYVRLHKSGYAHSVEAWSDGKLAGGLYGVSLGSAFFGESMFAIKSNASKAAFAALVEQLTKWKFTLIDCQITTAHLKSFGARDVPRSHFMKMLKTALKHATKKENWKLGS
jgi:leucyl/phenylalanyl-tRNA--protein transferase